MLSAAKCRPNSLVSRNIRYVRIFAGVPVGGGPQMRVGWSTTAIFGDLPGNLPGVATPVRRSRCDQRDLADSQSMII